MDPHDYIRKQHLSHCPWGHGRVWLERSYRSRPWISPDPGDQVVGSFDPYDHLDRLFHASKVIEPWKLEVIARCNSRDVYPIFDHPPDDIMTWDVAAMDPAEERWWSHNILHQHRFQHTPEHGLMCVLHLYLPRKDRHYTPAYILNSIQDVQELLNYLTRRYQWQQNNLLPTPRIGVPK